MDPEMKSEERHQLKQNEFAEGTMRVAAAVTQNARTLAMAVGAIVVVLVAVGLWIAMGRRAENNAGAALGIAMATAQAQIVPPPTVPGATQQPGTYPTEKARQEAALAAFQQVASTYPGTTAALTANYHAGGALLGLGRVAEAEAKFKEVAASAGSSIYGPMAQMASAEALRAGGKFDDAIKVLTDLAAQRDAVLPVDGVLMELARTCLKAGKTQEARAAFKRVVDEFPVSPYAADARQQMAALN